MMQSIKNVSSRALSIALAAGSVVTAAGAQAPATKITTRQLAAPTATSTEVLGSLAAVRQLPNGSVLVNDQAKRRVLLLDKELKLVGVVADSTPDTHAAYGARPGGLLAYRGDSTLFVDPASLSMLVIDPSGKIVRPIAAPRPNDVQFLTGGAFGNPGFDTKGRLVYAMRDNGMRGMRPPEPGKPFVMPTPPDSAAVVRFDLAARKLDTLGFYKIPKLNISMTQDDRGAMRASVTMNPLPVVDEWVVLSDGTVAIVRGQDYHVDLYGADGKTSAPKIPYEWQRMTDDDKTKFLDSSKAAIEKVRASVASGATSPQQAIGAAGGGAFSMGDGGGARQMIVIGGDGGGRGGPPPAGAPAGAAGGTFGNAGFTVPPVSMVPISELPDYKPVFGQNAVRADMDDHIWVRTILTKPTTGGAIYEVLNKEGNLVDRVQIPVGTTIAGFGAGGVIYLGFRDAAGIHVQRALSK
ncbi:MAG: hypothetical protein ABJE47_10010 [bacterium]